MLKFRPHHFLCTLGFQGKGYSPGFVANFQAIADRLRGPDLAVAGALDLAVGGGGDIAALQERFLCVVPAFLRRLCGAEAKQRFGLGTLGTMFTWLGAAFLLGAWAFRWAATGHAPYSNMYEYSMSFALGTTVAYAVVERKYHARTLGAMVLPVAS